MIPLPPIAYAVLAGLVLSAVTGVVGRLSGRAEYLAQGRAEIQAKWDRDRAAQQKALADALIAKGAAESLLSRQLQEQSDAHTAALAARDRAASDARRELARLRDALRSATAAGSGAGTAPIAAGPAPDGVASGAGQLLGACAGQLVELGERADGLAAQVIGLQAYARTAQQACGMPL